MRPLRPLLSLALVAAAACDRAPSRAAPADRALAALASRATGVWRVQLTLAGTPSTDSAGTPPPSVEGTLSLIESASGDAGTWIDATPTHTGTYDLATEPLGFALRATSPVPSLVAAVASSDSVYVVLPAGANDGVLVLRGRLAGDSARGRWRYESRAAGGWSGTFSLAARRDR